MPGRYVREGILSSERVDTLSIEAELFFRRLMSAVDDYGRFQKHSSLLRAALFPLRLDKVNTQDIDRWISECEAAELLESFVDLNGKSCIEIRKFEQRRRSPSKHPRAEDVGQMSDKSPTNDGQMCSNPSASSRSISKTSNGSGATKLLQDFKKDHSALVFDRSKLLGSLESMLGPAEWKQNGPMWRMRARDLAQARALKNALEDFAVRTPEQRGEIKNRGAWLTKRFEQCQNESKAA